MTEPVVAIVGRPNVGKSTLFNRLVEKRQAIVDRTSGVTRDRVYGKVEWSGREFTVIDTGGLTFSKEYTLQQQVREQVEVAVKEANLVLFVVDAVQQVTSLDSEVAAYLRRYNKKVLLVANKVDPAGREEDSYIFYQLGMGDPLPVSATHGLGIGDLLDKIIEELPPGKEENAHGDPVKVAVVGKPNAGKSMLINRLVEQERSIVNEVPGTTRDNVDVLLQSGDCRLLLVDTAGIRKKSKVKESVEYYSVNRSLKAIDRSDVVLLVVDGTGEITEQDKKIAGYINDSGRGIIITVNKWDLVKEKGANIDRFKSEVLQDLSFISFAPVVIISALTGWRVNRLIDRIKLVEEEHAKRISTPVLNELLQDAVLVNPPPSRKGSRARFYFVTQPDIKPPGFVFFVNDPGLVHFSYLRYLENRLREAFGFEGVPIRIKLKPRG